MGSRVCRVAGLPPVGFVLAFLLAFPARALTDFGGGGIGSGIGILIAGGLLSYVIFGLPAFVAGAMFAVARGLIPGFVVSHATGAVIGFVVTAPYAQLVFGSDGAALGIVGAFTGVVYAIWVQCRRWADDPSAGA